MDVDYVAHALGEDHEVTKLLRRFKLAYDFVTGLDDGVKQALTRARVVFTRLGKLQPHTASVDAVEALIKKYPLLNRETGAPGLLAFAQEKRRDAWVDYIKLIDRQETP